jgi:regulator of extracellular matrix RemA (YlzA/DUF370 family)
MDNTTHTKAMTICRGLPDYDMYEYLEPIIAPLVNAIISPQNKDVTYIQTAQRRRNMTILSLALAACMIHHQTNAPQNGDFMVLCPYQVDAEIMCEMTCKHLSGRADVRKSGTSLRMGTLRVVFTYPRNLRSVIMRVSQHVFIMFNCEMIPKTCQMDIFGALQSATSVISMVHPDSIESVQYLTAISNAINHSKEQSE